LAKPKKTSETPWKITDGHYKALGDVDRQIEFYLDETLQRKINEHLSNGKPDREEERARWKDLLFLLVTVAPNGGFLTKIVSQSELQRMSEEIGCKVNFTTMVEYLANENQRILREDRRPSGDTRSGEDALVPSLSLGHDAIALELSKWRDTRSLIVDKTNYILESIKNIMGKAAGVLLAIGVLVLAIVLSHEAWWGVWVWWPIAAVLAAGAILHTARTRIARSLTKRIASTAMFRRLTDTEQERTSERSWEAIQSIQDSIKAGQAAQPSAPEREALKGTEEALRAKPEKDYTASDWVRRAFAAYADGKLDLAAEYFDQAASAAGVTEAQRAEYLFYRGALFSELHRPEEAIVVYDDVLARFGSATELPLREQVARGDG
jgi:tetratricopeptide (TPR) repeat protein